MPQQNCGYDRQYSYRVLLVAVMVLVYLEHSDPLPSVEEPRPLSPPPLSLNLSLPTELIASSISNNNIQLSQ